MRNSCKANLGLDEKTWDYLSQTVDHIFHAGALVNHVLPYQHLFETNVLLWKARKYF
ncbi:SDR family oxidoreductase [Candidatus Arsenophonus triatominarum]|uniref:SDR family oxidoreductase n=1 Tax=Candidatus Arsenophonus triatominarum TaxID=57911 RepID=UPI0016505650|nr:SDR family oxidoreductase [Candidatus Arsenophonus triatominarum]